ncbi:carbonic anhydrase [Arthrobacter livingstonensis]|uniref:carbonic anhydrase n=1 Tax=Arthrobacter livingstonensis TaxID=670078 RepID=A0A2V5M0I0_9MICC|nr:carbonic anhydrase [Arthrobacter livingstonensis]PYI68536.1 carbonic anhydrase [Arthrobacter livingstonensis]
MSTPHTPAEAWTTLMSGNRRFVEASASHPNQDAVRRASLTSTQHPFVMIFGCSDSRLAAEIIFDLGLGDAFVVRTAGHVIDNTALGSLEYGIEYLDIPLIVVLGHDSCGAVTATKGAVETGAMPAGFVRDLVERITPSVLASLRKDKDSDVNAMVEEHVKQTAARLVENSPIIAGAVARQKTAVVGLTYRLNEGRADLVYSNGPIGL